MITKLCMMKIIPYTKTIIDHANDEAKGSRDLPGPGLEVLSL
jgi:hypothetical protein